MPIIERRPQRAFDEFESHIEGLVRAVLPLPAGVRLGLTTRGEFGVLEFVRGGIGTSVELATHVGPLWFSINQELVAVREQKRRYRLRTRRYGYRLSRSAGSRAEAILRWEYDSATDDDAQCRHHSHAASAISLGQETLNLDRLHIPTGWVLIEHVLRFLFHDLGVVPRDAGWPDRLRASETRFHEEFTSKGYKFLR
jgi:hypothetical protein